MRAHGEVIFAELFFYSFSFGPVSTLIYVWTSRTSPLHIKRSVRYNFERRCKSADSVARNRIEAAAEKSFPRANRPAKLLKMNSSCFGESALRNNALFSPNSANKCFNLPFLYWSVLEIVEGQEHKSNYFVAVGCFYGTVKNEIWIFISK